MTAPWTNLWGAQTGPLGFPSSHISFAISSAKNLVCYIQTRSPGFWSSFLLIINKFKACRKWVVLSISGCDLFWQIALADFKLQRWSTVRHQSSLRVQEKEKKRNVNIIIGNTSGKATSKPTAPVLSKKCRISKKCGNTLGGRKQFLPEKFFRFIANSLEIWDSFKPV